MTLAQLRAYCMTLPGATHDIKWGADHCYSVGGRMFAVTGTTKEDGVSIKVDDNRFLELTDRPGIVPAPYLARAKWVKVVDFSALPDAQFKELIARSHAIIASKLTKKVRDGLK